MADTPRETYATSSAQHACPRCVHGGRYEHADWCEYWYPSPNAKLRAAAEQFRLMRSTDATDIWEFVEKAASRA